MALSSSLVRAAALLALTAGSVGAAALLPTAAAACPTVSVVAQVPFSQINNTSPGMAGCEYGMEDGNVIRASDGSFHLVTAEMVGDPKWVDMQLGHWTSIDGWAWSRVGTLKQGSSNFNGTDQRSSVWGPMFLWDAELDTFALLYVGYRGAPDNATGWLGNYDGTIWLSYSSQPGPGGINGPYTGDRIIFQPANPAPGGPWAPCEGLQGTDSMYPYPLSSGGYFGLYGTAHTENGNTFAQKWVVCGAAAASLNSSWSRTPASDPLGSVINITAGGFTENPIVYPYPAGAGGAGAGYMVIFDLLNDQPHSFGFSCSSDGMAWQTGVGVPISTGARTPMGLLPLTPADVEANAELLQGAGLALEAALAGAAWAEGSNTDTATAATATTAGSALYWLFYTVEDGPGGWETFHTAIANVTWA